MIRYFDTEAAYEAAALSADESDISLVGENNEVKFDGRNVVVGLKSAKTGDLVLMDSVGALHFVSQDTYNASTFPMDAYTAIGVVAAGVDDENFRGTVVIVHKTHSTSEKWSNVYSWRLTGYTCDGTDRTGVLSIRSASDNWAANVAYTISYNASSVADLVDQLNTYFRANEPFTTQSWVAEGVDTDDDDVVDAIDLKVYFTAWQQSNYTTASDGFSVTANFMPSIAPTNNMLRKNGRRAGEGTVGNIERALAYFAQDLSITTYNPASDVTTTVLAYPICKPAYLGTSAYQSDHCAYLRSVYGAGEAGWQKFMESFLPVFCTKYGSVGDKLTYGDGKTNTYLLAGKTFTKQDGTVLPLSPAADYAAAVGYADSDVAAVGQWELPDSETLLKVMRNIKYGTDSSADADTINAGLNLIGGTFINNGSYAWSASRSGASNAWYFVGYFGVLTSNYFFSSLRALPVLLLKTSEASL